MNKGFRLITPNEKRSKKVRRIFIVLLIIIVILFALFMIKYYAPIKSNNNNNTTTTSTTSSTTTPTTTVESTTTTTVITTTGTTTKAIEYAYNYKLNKDNYNIYVCNKDGYKRITKYKVLNNNITLGVSSDKTGITVHKNIIDVSNNPTLLLRIDNKDYSINKDDNCK